MIIIGYQKQLYKTKVEFLSQEGLFRA